MSMTATERIASLDDDALTGMHDRLDGVGPADPNIVHAHHLVTTEMARRGMSHGHDSGEWVDAVVLIESHDVDSPEDIEAPEGFEKAWGETLADGGTISVILTVDGYVLKADPTVSDVHVDTIMGGKKKKPKPPMVDQPADGQVAKSIIEQDGKFVVTSKDGSREFGTYDTMEEARRRLAQIEQFAKADWKAGDFASWDSSGGTARGKVARIVREGVLQVPDSSFKVMAEDDDPAVLLEVFREGPDGWMATGTMVGHKASTLSRMESLAKAGTFTPPEGVQSAARQALKWIEDGHAGSGFTAVGRGRASQLAAGKAVSAETVNRMRSYFARHAIDKQAEGWGDKSNPTPGMVAWYAWGGDAGRAWVNGLDTVDKAYEPEEALSDRDQALYEALEQVVEQFGDFSPADAHYMPADDNPFSGKGMVCANCVFYEGGGGCEILQEQVEPLALCKFWIIDSSLLKAQEAPTAPVGRLMLPDGTVYEQTVMPFPSGGGGGVFKHLAGQHDQASHGDWAAGGGGTDLSPEADRFIRSNLSRGNLVESYGAMYDMGKGARGFGQAHIDRSVADKIDKRDRALSQYMGQERSIATEGAAFAAAQHQGYIDGVLGRRARYARSHSFGETIAGLFTGGLSGAMKSAELAKHLAGKHDQKTHGSWAGSVPSVAGGPGTAGGDGGGGVRPDVKKSIEVGIAFGRGPDRKGRDTVKPPETVDEFRRATADAVANRDPNRQIMRPGKPDPRYPDKPETIPFDDGLEIVDLSSRDSLWHSMVPDGKGGWTIDPERLKVHEEIAQAMIAGPPPPGRVAPMSAIGGNRPLAVFLGGGPAAGKTTMERTGGSGIPDSDSRVTIAPDHAKFALPEYADMVAEGKAGADAAAGFVHEESSVIAKRAQALAEQRRQSIVIDGLGDSGPPKLKAKVDRLRSRGYDVIGRYATVPTEEAVSRAAKRAERTGFKVNEGAVRTGHRKVSAIANNIDDIYDNVEVYFTDTPAGTPPIKIAQATRTSGWSVLDQAQWDAFLAKGSEQVAKAADDGEGWLRELASRSAMEGLGDLPFEAGIDSDDSPYMRAIYPDWDELMQASRDAADKAMAEAAQSPTLMSKAVDEKRFTLGPMYVPDRLDAHAEWTDVEELQKAVWQYVKKGDRRIRLQHDRDVVAGEFVEIMAWPYEVEVPMMMKDASTKPMTFPANTVFLGVQWEPWAWELVKAGKLRGYSIGGRAQRMFVDLPEA